MSSLKTFKKKLFYNLVAALPRPLRHEFYRRRFARIPTQVPKGLTFELARTKEDLETAFRLLHDAYVEQGFIQAQASGMRLIIQHALPTTSILIAKQEGQVVGTISVMRDTALGLPMEKVFDISHLKKNGKRIAELSCLAIHPKFRRSIGGSIFFPLTLFAAMFAERSFGTDYLIWNLFPQHADFYNAIFGSTYLSYDTKNYLGAPATAIQVDLAQSRHFAKKTYSGLPLERDLYAYTYLTEHKYFVYPSTHQGSINHPVMTPAIFNYFLSEKTELLKNLTELEEQVIARYYPLPNYAVVIPLRKSIHEDQRLAPRWDTRLQAAVMVINESHLTTATILDVSKAGLRAHVQESLIHNQSYQLKVQMDSGSIALVTAKPIWQDKDGVTGFQIVQANTYWDELVEHQAEKLKRLIS